MSESDSTTASSESIDTGLTIFGDWLYLGETNRVRLSSVVSYSLDYHTIELLLESRESVEVTVYDRELLPTGARAKAALAQLDRHFLLTSVSPR